MAELTALRSSGSVITKENLKSLLRVNRTAYKAAEVLYENSILLRHILEHRLGGVVLGRQMAPALVRARQSVMTWNVPFGPWDNAQHLIESLRSRGVQISEGGHTFYIAPQDVLNRVIPEIVAAYPNQSGFKILKDCRHPLDARYFHKHRHSLRLLRRLIGTPQDQLVAANYMYRLGIGPRIWDLTCWRSEGQCCAVFVVDHVSGRRPTTEQCMAFKQELKQLIQESHLRVLIPAWEQNVDFLPPDCNGNLIYSPALRRAQYVDFQNFVVRNRASGSWRQLVSKTASHNLGATGRDKDQSQAALVGSEQAADERWTFILGVLRKSLATLARRVVLHVGCGSGETLHLALMAGANWAVGWDGSNDVATTQRRLFSLGTTRFSLFGAQLHANYRLNDDLPRHLQHQTNGAVVFYSAGRQSIESLKSFSTMGWDALVYEGDRSESLSDVRRELERLLKSDLEVIAGPRVSVGSPGCRPLMVIRRKSVSAA